MMTREEPSGNAPDPTSRLTDPPAARDVIASDKALEHVWRYFALHAQQRIAVFNFFVVLSGVLATAIGGGLQAGRPLAPLVAVLGCLLMLLAFVFWRLDQRGSELVKHSEDALRSGERAVVPEYARVFVREGMDPSGPIPRRATWTFGRSFRSLFLFMAIAGAGASCYAGYRCLTEPTRLP